MTLNDLPEIQIKRHLRAKRLKLSVEPHQIRLTAPVFCTQKQIQNFIDQSTLWMIETWQQQQTKADYQNQALPEKVHVFNSDQEIHVVYQKQKMSFDWHDISKTVYISDRQPKQYLKEFIVAYAKIHLPIFLMQISQTVNLPYQKCSIRQPKTRWGSCSIRKDIMLNSALVLFPKEVTRYVCVHELAHTVHFDHSPQFWEEVKKHDLNYKQHRKMLKEVVMPYWWWS